MTVHRHPPAPILRTARLHVRPFDLGDAAFVLELLNEPPFHEFIGDKGVRTLDDARGYLQSGPLASYAQHGFGLWLVALAPGGAGGEELGMCGLLKRDDLPDVDIGFAFLERHWGRGYAFEAATAVMEHGRGALGLPRIVALTAVGNARSAALLNKLGLRFEGKVRLGDGGEESCLFTPDPDRGRPPALRWRRSSNPSTKPRGRARAMEMPKPNADHLSLARLAGTWRGTETMHPSPWDPKGGEAEAVSFTRVALDGFVVVTDYEQSRGGQRTFAGHGVYAVDAEGHEVVLYWWDSTGQAMEEFRGNWDGDRLQLRSEGAMGQFRMTTTLTAPDKMTSRMETSSDGTEWTALFDGRYSRD